MPGAKQFTIANRVRNTGVRAPREVGLLSSTGARFLNPWFSHPVRAGETIRGLSVLGDVCSRRMVQYAFAPMCYGEVALWLVPLSSMGSAFVDLVVASAEEGIELTLEDLESGTVADTTGNLTLEDNLQLRNRRWAGEIGSAETPIDTGTLYMPYTSRATWTVASNWYDIEWRPGIDRLDTELYESPPEVAEFIRYASVSGYSLGIGADDDNPTSDSISTIIERMSLLTKTERSYAEYLAGFGIDPRRVDSLPRPLFIEQMFIKPHQMTTGMASSSTAAPQSITADDTLMTFEVAPASGEYGLFDQNAMGHMAAPISRFRQRDILVEEPSVILGTCVWYDMYSDIQRFTHYMDLNHFVQGSHWGDVAFGGIEETDFIATTVKKNGTATADQVGPDGESAALAMNLLNKYMHGDVFSNSDIDFNWRTHGGASTLLSNRTMNWRLSAQLYIGTDMGGM